MQDLLIPTFSVRTRGCGLPARRLRRIAQFKGIQHLDLKVCVKVKQAEHLVPFIKSLEQGNLKSLRLNVSKNDKSLTSPFLGATLSKLESLELVGGGTSVAELVSFAQRHATLKELNLTDFGIHATREEKEAYDNDEIHLLGEAIGVPGSYAMVRCILTQ